MTALSDTDKKLKGFKVGGVDYVEWLRLIEANSKRMLELITERLDINRIEAAQRNLSFEKIELTALLFESVYCHYMLAEKKTNTIAF